MTTVAMTEYVQVHLYTDPISWLHSSTSSNHNLHPCGRKIRVYHLFFNLFAATMMCWGLRFLRHPLLKIAIASCRIGCCSDLILAIATRSLSFLSSIRVTQSTALLMDSATSFGPVVWDCFEVEALAPIGLLLLRTNRCSGVSSLPLSRASSDTVRPLSQDLPQGFERK